VARVGDEIGASTGSRYRVLAKLAIGGMAEIYLAHGAGSAGVDRYCVLKRILRTRAHDADVVKMFLAEARLGAQLQHPNIASVYDLGTLADSYFFTMEYVHGESVRTVMQCARALGRSLPLSCVLTIIAGAAAGLDHAHRRSDADGQPLGIVHRDVSPSNLMVGYEGHVKVVDFGVAKVANRELETRTGTIKGKISYLSPEQSRGEPVDRRSDLFSLGIVMWEMLTGARLYQRSSDFATMTAIVHEQPPRPSQHRPELPAAVDDLVLRLLAKRSCDRFQTAAELIEAIEAVAQETGAVLSTTAVRRLIHELFGARLEPWLARDRPLGRAVTLATGPLPVAELAPTMNAPLEEELASVPDLAAGEKDEPTASASESSDYAALGSWQLEDRRRVTEVHHRTATRAPTADEPPPPPRARAPIAVVVASLLVAAGVLVGHRSEPLRAVPAPRFEPTVWAPPARAPDLAELTEAPIATPPALRLERPPVAAPPRRAPARRHRTPSATLAVVSAPLPDDRLEPIAPLVRTGLDAPPPTPPPPPPAVPDPDPRCLTNLRDCR
jgi:tRNA A-37 threonylcarbamoyl transferase component Bud32